MTEETLFIEALEIADPAGRAVFLDQACAGNPDLRGRLDRLLAEHAQAGSFLGTSAALPKTGPLAAPAGDTTNALPTARPDGGVIGPYKLVEVIGEGGMGTVWLAQQQEPVKRLVALKVIKAGMDSKQVLARFEAERQALALMDHPNIAKVLDGGTTPDGRPYFAMELVKGVPITKFCDERRLSPRERLELFVPVCQAVQHAHQKGVIHRDIKPTNVMVALYDGKPVPKVIDFGIAKAAGQSLTERTLITGLGAVVGTPEYMSPEQAELNQLDIDTRSDIYSLGILLYELLTGSTPLQRKRVKEAALLEVLRLVREEEPPRPSTRLSTTDELPSIAANRGVEPRKLSGLMRRELDWIVMRALEKDRSRRYETANGFAMDVQRYLADEAVQACPPSVRYRFRKFARRNKRGLAAATMVLLVLMLLGGGAGWAIRDRGARQARAAGQVELILAEVDQLEQEQKWPEALAATRRAEAVVAGGDADAATEQRIRDRLKDHEFIDRLEQARMLQATWVGQGFDYVAADRAYVEAFQNYGVEIDQQSIDTSVRRLQTRPQIVLPVAAALDGWSAARRGSKRDEADWKRLIAVARGIDPEPTRDRLRATVGRPGAEVKDELLRMAESIDLRSQHPATIKRLAKSLQLANQSDAALRLWRAAQALHPSDFWFNYELAIELKKRNDHEGAVRFNTAALAIRPQSTATLLNLGIALSAQKKLDEALVCIRRAIEIDPRFTLGYNGLGNALWKLRKLDEAEHAFLKVIEIDPKLPHGYVNLGALLCDTRHDYERAVGYFHKAIELDPNLVNAYAGLGFARSKQKKLVEAIAAFRKAVELDPKDINIRGDLGSALLVQGNANEAIPVFRNVIELDPKNVSAYSNLGVALARQKKFDDAVAMGRKAIEIDSKFITAYVALGNTLIAQGKSRDAITAYNKAIELDPKFANAYFGLGNALAELKQLDDAVVAYRKAIELDPNDPKPLVNLGNVLRHLKKFDEAVAACRKAIELDPQSAQVYTLLGGILCDDLKDYDASIECLRKVVQLRPKDPSSYRNLAFPLHRRGRVDEATGVMRTAVELDPKDAANRGLLARDLNNRAWGLATNLDPKNRDPARATKLAKEAVGLEPGNGFYMNTLGVALYRASDWKAAVAALDKSVELRKGGDADDWLFLAMAHWQLGEKSEARKWYDKSVEWMTRKNVKSGETARLRAEVEALLGIEKPGSSDRKP